MSAIDINGRSVWINTFQNKPLLLGDFYNRNGQNTFDDMFAALVQSRAVLEFGLGCQLSLIIILYHKIFVKRTEYIGNDK